jgi:hypothetical protein
MKYQASIDLRVLSHIGSDTVSVDLTRSRFWVVGGHVPSYINWYEDKSKLDLVYTRLITKVNVCYGSSRIRWSVRMY